MTANHSQDLTPTGLTPARRWMRWLPCAVLIAAIAAQGVLMATVNADRQAGSGFAMFSSVDFAGSRTVSAEAEFDGNQFSIDFPAALDDDIDQLLITPTDALAADLAAQIKQLRWSSDDGVIELDSSGAAAANVVVIVRGLDNTGRTLTSHVLATGTAP